MLYILTATSMILAMPHDTDLLQDLSDFWLPRPVWPGEGAEETQTFSKDPSLQVFLGT